MASGVKERPTALQASLANLNQLSFERTHREPEQASVPTAEASFAQGKTADKLEACSGPTKEI